MSEDEPSTLERWLDRAAAAGGAVLVLATVLTAFLVRGPVPIHFNAAGQADRWGSDGVLLVVAALAFALWMGTAGLRGLPVVPAVRGPYREMMAALGACVTWLFAVLATFTGGMGAGVLPAPGPVLDVVTFAVVGVPLAVFAVRLGMERRRT